MEIYENLDLNDLEGEIWKDIAKFESYQVSNLGRVKSFKKWHGTDIRILEPIKNNHGYFCVNLCKHKKQKFEQIHRLLFENFNNYKLKKNECVHHIDFVKKNNFLYNLQVMSNSEHRKLHTEGENNPMFGKKRPEHSEKMKGEKHFMYGKHHSEKSKEKNRLSHIGKHPSEKTKKLISEQMSGEYNPNSTLKDGEVWLIKKILNSDYYKSGKITLTFIGKMFGVSRHTISHIKNNKIWKHI